MPVLLTVVGAIIAVLGLAMAAYGVPVKEFSFGNTLILAGSMAVVGGLVIVAIGAMISELRRVAEMLAARAPLQTGHPAEPFGLPAPSRPMQPPIPFPERPKPAAAVTSEPAPLRAAPFAIDQAATAPMLRNPEASASSVEQFEVPVHEDISLSPPPAPADQRENEPLPPPPSPVRPDRIIPPPPSPGHRPEPPSAFADESWSSAPPPPPPRSEHQTQTSYFDTMWPADTLTPKRQASEELEPGPEPQAATPPETPSEPVAILKSGVVDGMAYTLYVDGSIEAELPHGTLRFASIHELRDHLAKGS